MKSGMVAAIVVTFNRKELLKECIAALLTQSVKDLDILIIDNASADGTADYIAECLSNESIRYFNTGKNIGGAGGFQYGIIKAAAMGYKYLWLMDDDSIPSESALQELLDLDKHLKGRYGYLSSKVLWTDGSLCRMNIQRRSLRKDVTDFESPYTRSTMATFVSLFLRTDMVKRVGLPIKEFFIWCDDAEYTRRISLRYPSYVANKSIVVHKTKLNYGSDISKDDYGRIDRYWYLYRNSVYFYRREGVKGIVLKGLQVLLHICRVLLTSPDHKMGRVKMILSGTKDGMRFHPAVEYLE